MGFEPTTLRDLVGCSNHWATGDSMVSKGHLWVPVKSHKWPLLTIESPVAQWLEHPTRSRRVVGSNPKNVYFIKNIYQYPNFCFVAFNATRDSTCTQTPTFWKLYTYILFGTRAVRNSSTCIRLVRGKFELTNQDSVGGKNSSVLSDLELTSQERHWNQANFLTGDGIKCSRKRIYNFKNQTSWQKVKIWTILCF